MIELNVTEDAPIVLDVESSPRVRMTIAEQIINQGGAGLSDEVKQALLDCFAHVAWIDEHGQDYYDALYAALYPPVELDYITAAYTQSGTVYDTDTLDSLKADLVVTAFYDDGTSEPVTAYTLSGTLEVGTSTITVSYGGKTTIFTVTVFGVASISAVYTQSGEVYTDDSLDVLKSGLVVTAEYSDGTTETVSADDYVLSGSLTSGTSAITVTYSGKTATFNVTVTAPLYSVPDFSEQTITDGGKSLTVKKENGYYTMSGTYAGVVYIYPDGTVHITRSTDLWFEITSGASVTTEIKDLTWNNPGSTALTLSAKLSRSDTTGNLFTVTYQMAANQSGTVETQTGVNTAGGLRKMSAVGIQMENGTRTYTATSTFKMRLFVNGVRYL